MCVIMCACAGVQHSGRDGLVFWLRASSSRARFVYELLPVIDNNDANDAIREHT